jgi:hypothetical protein
VFQGHANTGGVNGDGGRDKGQGKQDLRDHRASCLT